MATDRPLAHTPKEDSMSDLTRRGFVTSSAAATAGMTALGAALLTERARAETQGAELEAGHGTAGSDPVVAYIRDPGSGHISVMVGDREVNVHDRKLAARIARAAR